MKHLFFTVLVLCSLTVFAQLGFTKAEIIRAYGNDYAFSVLDNGEPYMVYKKQAYSASSGVYTQVMGLYFVTPSSGEPVCYLWKIFLPDTETNANIIYYNNTFPVIGNTRWKDYTLGVIYDIEVKDGWCIISAWYDN
ncbi:hypothetical protein DSECCO2_533100 [anaerobic digester metagenome]